MKHYAGLDVSVKETCVCIVDGTGTVCREVKVPSHPQDLLRILQDPTWRLERIGLEAGPLSQWLFEGLADAGLPVVCIETRHTKAFLKAQLNKKAKSESKYKGRKPTVASMADQIRELAAQGQSMGQIAKQLGIGKGSVHRALRAA